ncbi:hypothetical protein ACFL52_05200, partial [Candidatus Margulisiibacteriota bacterium]
RDLNELLKKEGIELKKPGSGKKQSEDIFNKRLERDLSKMPQLDTFFNEKQIFHVKETKSKDQNIYSSNLKFSNAPISKGEEYFKKTYAGKKWSAMLVNKFKREVTQYLKQNFCGVPVTTAAEARDAVNDHFSKQEVSDLTIQEFSKNKSGQARIDCGVYAQITHQIYKTVGLKNIQFGFGVMEELSSAKVGGACFG